MKKIFRCVVLLFAISTLSFSQQYKVLYNFRGSANNDGSGPFSGLLRDGSGNLYGTTYTGGQSDAGTIFELSPLQGGSWKETVLYSFCTSGDPCLDGAGPQSTLIMDPQGNLYGTTAGGGSGGAFGQGEGGVAFELSPPSQQGGTWTETVLYNFCSVYEKNECQDGNDPLAGVVFDSKGDLFGTTYNGGSHGEGNVYELSPSGSGWTETTLYNFCSNPLNEFCLDGALPQSSLLFDKSGNLYGTTAAGGIKSGRFAGTLFELSPGSKGWTETVLVNFNQPGGIGADSGPTSDASGNLYGSLRLGGGYSSGGLFQWNHSNGKLRELSFNGANGQAPAGSVLIDPLGRGFFGTTLQGGNNGGGSTAGVVYQVSPKGKLTTLYKFCSQPNCADGASPYGNLVEDSQGNLYGTTFTGGAYNAGVVFEITP